MPSSVDLIIPYMPDEGLRDKNFHYLTSLWEEHHPSVGIHVGLVQGMWNKAKAIDNALKTSSAEIIIVADADVWCEPRFIVRAAHHVARKRSWSMPHQKVYRMDKATSAQWTPEYRGKVRYDRQPYPGVPGGGLFVIRREDYNLCPMDPRFVGHSGQDIAWAHSAHTLVGPLYRLSGKLWHLYHEPQPTKRDPEYSKPNFRLMRQYALARGNTMRTRQLVNEGRVS